MPTEVVGVSMNQLGGLTGRGLAGRSALPIGSCAVSGSVRNTELYVHRPSATLSDRMGEGQGVRAFSLRVIVAKHVKKKPRSPMFSIA